MITIGLDFGTHQTKVCAEYKNGVELNYTFFTFLDSTGKQQYTLPSIIHRRPDGRMDYGYIPANSNGEIIRYFKQATFTVSNIGLKQTDAMYYSVWYLAFILFDLEEKYGTEFTIQMGVPTDGSRLTHQKQLVVRLLAAAYKLVEEVFENDKQAFLDKTWGELWDMTKIPDYSINLKEEYGILVFPEAYACLMPLISSSKVTSGMSLMVDIGGGTTDISFFTIIDHKPRVYDFTSVNKGLNYLTLAERRAHDTRTDSNIKISSEIDKTRKGDFTNSVNQVCVNLINKLRSEFKHQCNLRVERLMDALKTRPIIYTGGGSTFHELRKGYGGFRDVIHISQKEWRTKAIIDMKKIEILGLCPILSTAYGLSISVPDDNIKCSPFRDVFESIRGLEEENSKKTVDSNFGSAYDGFNYADDWDAWK